MSYYIAQDAQSGSNMFTYAEALKPSGQNIEAKMLTDLSFTALSFDSTYNCQVATLSNQVSGLEYIFSNLTDGTTTKLLVNTFKDIDWSVVSGTATPFNRVQSISIGKVCGENRVNIKFTPSGATAFKWRVVELDASLSATFEHQVSGGYHYYATKSLVTGNYTLECEITSFQGDTVIRRLPFTVASSASCADPATPTPTITTSPLTAGTPPFAVSGLPHNTPVTLNIFVNGSTTASQSVTVTTDGSGVANLSALSFTLVAGQVITCTATAQGYSASAISNQVQVNAATTYQSAVRTASFTKNNCGAGQTGSTVQMSTTAGQFLSTVSQADADAQADAYIQANGQANANSNGTCSVAPTKLTIPTSYTGSQIVNGATGQTGSISGISGLPTGSTYNILSGSSVNCTASIDAQTGQYTVSDTGGTAQHTCTFVVQIKDASGTVIGTIPVNIPVAAATNAVYITQSSSTVDNVLTSSTKQIGFWEALIKYWYWWWLPLLFILLMAAKKLKHHFHESTVNKLKSWRRRASKRTPRPINEQFKKIDN